MIKKVFLPVVLLFTALQFQGCRNLTMLRTQELRDVKAQVDSLQSELTAMQKEMLEEQKSQSEVLRLLRADIQIRFNELDRKVSTIDGNLSESQSRLSKIDEKTAEFNKRLEAKLIADSSRSSETEKFFQLGMNDFNAGRYDIALSGFKDLAEKFPNAAVTQDAEYYIAECNYAKKSYNDAESAYMGYIKKYPQGSKMCGALY